MKKLKVNGKPQNIIAYYWPDATGQDWKVMSYNEFMYKFNNNELPVGSRFVNKDFSLIVEED